MERDTKNIRGIILNPNSGEIEGYLYDGDRVVKVESIESKKKQEETRHWIMENFFKGNIKELTLLSKDLNSMEKAFLFSIAPYVSYEDCCLKYGNGVDICSQDLVKITGLSKGKTYEVINSLIDKDILYRGKNSKNRQYYANPWLFCKGNRINKVLKNMFKNYKVRVCGNKCWKDIKDRNFY